MNKCYLKGKKKEKIKQLYLSVLSKWEMGGMKAGCG